MVWRRYAKLKGILITHWLAYLHRSVDGDHFVIVVRIGEYIVNVVLASRTGDDRRTALPIGGHIAGKTEYSFKDPSLLATATGTYS